jgi:hypothetical protein
MTNKKNSEITHINKKIKDKTNDIERI